MRYLLLRLRRAQPAFLSVISERPRCVSPYTGIENIQLLVREDIHHGIWFFILFPARVTIKPKQMNKVGDFYFRLILTGAKFNS
jgi:hypothetical protein